MDSTLVKGLAALEWITGYHVASVTERDHRPAFGVGDGIAEEVEEGGAEELVGQGEGLLAFPTQTGRLVQNPRNPLLLRQRRQRKVHLA